MSNKLSGRVWELDLDHAESHVLLALADNAHDDGTHCYPSVPFLAWKSGYSERQVQRILRTLDAKGIIRTYRKKVRAGTFQYFTLHLDNAPEKPPFERGDILSDAFRRGGDILSEGDDKMSERGDVVSDGHDKMSPKPLVEPSVETLEEIDTRAKRVAASGGPSPTPPIEKVLIETPVAISDNLIRAREASERQREKMRGERIEARAR
jgi:hypothetical protein